MALEESSALDAGLSLEVIPRQDSQGSIKKKKNWEKSTAEPNKEEIDKKEEEPTLGKEAEIERLTKAGHQALIHNCAKQALSCFKRALSLSEETLDGHAQRICAFNLGAAYVEARKPDKGLPFLLRAQPVEAEGPEHLGDLFFNIGVARQGLGEFAGALESFRKARDHYRSIQAGGEAGTYVKMGCCYLDMKDTTRAIQCFLEAGRAYEEVGSPEPAAVALSRAAGLMCQSGGHGAGEIANVLHTCQQLCGRISNRDLLGKLYNNIGLGFSQIKIFSLAAESFEEALSLCQEEEATTDLGKEAAILQNLGAAHNTLGNFGTAVGLHQRAASLHGCLGNRRAQGQCFCNMAFAFSQLGDHEAAGENYLHALQAFKDAGDLPGQWQACEGLGSSQFHVGDPEKAILHYKEALTLISKCQDVSNTIQERIVNKLTDALQYKLSRNSSLFHSPGILPPAPTKRLPGSHPASQVRFTTSLHHMNKSFPPMFCQASESSLGQEDCPVQPTPQCLVASSMSHGPLQWREVTASQNNHPKPNCHRGSGQKGFELVHPRMRALQRIGAAPVGFPSQDLESHQPRWRERWRSITCTLM